MLPASQASTAPDAKADGAEAGRGRGLRTVGGSFVENPWDKVRQHALAYLLQEDGTLSH